MKMLAALLFLIPAIGHAAQVCQEGDSINGVTFDWCVDQTVNSDRTLWFFHSANRDEHLLLDSTTYYNMKVAWITSVPITRIPAVVAVSFQTAGGSVWSVNDMPSATVAGAPVLDDFFVNHLYPYMMTKVNAKARGRVMLMGWSMGGKNALLFAGRHPELFERVVAGCPGLFTISPWSSEAEKDAYVAGNPGTIRAQVDTGLNILGADYPALADWNRNDPLQLAPWTKPLLVWWNVADQYGFDQGAPIYETAAPNGTSAFNAGIHCQRDPAVEAAMTEFLR